jgi:hypothetical protein
MNWIFDHLQVVIFIAVAVAGAVQKLREPSAPRPGSLRPSAADPGLEERTRRVQEEIRRKIAERRGRGEPSATPAPPRLRPAAAPVARERMPMRPAAVPPPPVAAAPAPEPSVASLAEEAAILARQNELAEQLARLKAAAQAERKAAASAGYAIAPAAKPGSARAAILADLRVPAGVRRALVLREILGEPVGRF